MKSIKLFLLLAATFTAACTTTPEEPIVETLAEGRLEYIQLSGAPYERGKLQGELLRPKILQLVEAIKQDIQVN